MNFSQNNKNPMALLALLLFCGGCGQDASSTQDQPECTVTLKRSESQTLSATNSEIIYKGELSESCVQQTFESSGTTQVKITTQTSEANESVSLKQLKAGSRTMDFDPESDNLKRGRIETEFNSSLLPEWSVPWKDRPNLISLSIVASSETNPNSIPTDVTVELNF